MSIIPSPERLSFEEWSNALKEALPELNISRAPKVEKWREWAASLLKIDALSNMPIPRLAYYPKTEDWKTWAEEFIYLFNN